MENSDCLMTNQILAGVSSDPLGLEWFPAFTCDQNKNYHQGMAAIWFCTSEKVILLMSIMAGVILGFQAHLQMKYFKKKCYDLKIGILIFASITEFYVLFHYGIMPPTNKGTLFVVIELNRFVVFYLLCFYYTDRSSGLLKKRRVSKNVLNFLMITGLCLIVWFGIDIGVRVHLYKNGDKENGIDPNTLCFNI